MFVGFQRDKFILAIKSVILKKSTKLSHNNNNSNEVRNMIYHTVLVIIGWLCLFSLQGLTNGVENDQNTANIPADLSNTRLSISSTTSNQSYDSGNVDYAVPKHSYPKHRSDTDSNDNITYNQPKITNPLFGVNAATNYSPGPLHDDKEKLPNGVRKAPEGQDNEAFKTEDVLDGRKEMLVADQISIADGGTATYSTDNNGKINVHVTVMINAGNYMHPYDNYKHYNIP